jgi:hypothetical protein
MYFGEDRSDVHFRLVPTLYTSVVAAIGAAVALATLPASPLLAGGAAVVTVAHVVKDVGSLFNRLNAQEAAVVGALSEAIVERRKTDPKAWDASAAQIEAVIRPRDLRLHDSGCLNRYAKNSPQLFPLPPSNFPNPTGRYFQPRRVRGCIIVSSTHMGSC